MFIEDFARSFACSSNCLEISTPTREDTEFAISPKNNPEPQPKSKTMSLLFNFIVDRAALYLVFCSDE
jgi:hypothetical protein